MKFLFSFLFLISTQTYAGWVSGGGELIEDAQNPWFLFNTKQVKYCVQIDETNFGQSLSSVRQRIEKAFKFWKVQFENTAYIYAKDYELGTQNFVEVSCKDYPDIRFQFGILTGDQIEKIKNPMNYIGLTIRTEYDQVNLKGKGFIYVSPQSGPLKLNLLNSEDIQSNWKPWSDDDGTLLLPTLIHEIGHIFGLKHDDQIFMMGDRYLENLFFGIGKKSGSLKFPNYWIDLEKNNKFLDLRLLKIDGPLMHDLMLCISAPISSEPITMPKPPRPRPLKGDLNLLIKETKSVFNSFFEIDNSEICLAKKLVDNNFYLYGSKENEPSKLIGSAKLVSREPNFYTKGIVNLWLTKEQNVFPKAMVYQSLGIAYMETRKSFKGTFKFSDKSKEKEIFITSHSNPRSLMISGEVNGKWYLDLESEF